MINPGKIWAEAKSTIICLDCSANRSSLQRVSPSCSYAKASSDQAEQPFDKLRALSSIRFCVVRSLLSLCKREDLLGRGFCLVACDQGFFNALHMDQETGLSKIETFILRIEAKRLLIGDHASSYRFKYPNMRPRHSWPLPIGDEAKTVFACCHPLSYLLWSERKKSFHRYPSKLEGVRSIH